jgi:hypothetical protein
LGILPVNLFSKIKKSASNSDGEVSVDYMKSDFDALELQWREAGQAMWRMAEKGSEKTIAFKPEVSTPGAPVKIELRAVYLVKNKRVGQWSPVYALTVGTVVGDRWSVKRLGENYKS